MNFLLSNDDGYDAPGLHVLVEALAPLGTCWVVAPETERSATGHALTLHRPLRVRRVRDRWWAVDGKPADCVYMGLHHLCPTTPDLVVCGINCGGNISLDVYYSGTVAAAREAAMAGVRAVASSLYVLDWDATCEAHHWDVARAVTRRLVEDLLAHPLPPDVIVNLNIPDRPAEELLGVRPARLGRRHWHVNVEERRDLKDRPYYWIGGNHRAFADLPGTDGPLVHAGWATVTPLALDATAEAWMDAVASLPLLAGGSAPSRMAR